MALAAVLLSASAIACSLALDASTTQCRDDAGCARFSGTVCDQRRHVCVAPIINVNTDASSDGDGDAVATDDAVACTGDAGLAPAPVLLTTCTDATCFPFDNRTRLRNLLPDGALAPLPDLTAVHP